MDYGIILHGGAWDIPDDAVDAHLTGIETALDEVFTDLEDGMHAIDVVETAVTILENDPTFDAGIGSHLNDIGEVEMDAIIATDDFNIGSVSAIQNVRNPIKVARLVRDRTEHVLLTGNGATRFAYSEGIEKVSPDKLLIGRELERYKQIKNIPDFSTKDAFQHQGFGTVGAVAKDKNGNKAIAVSTGGTPHKMAGRVGDTPLWGSGGYVESQGGAAATGFGEDLIRILATYRTIRYIENGKSAMEAANLTIKDLTGLVGGLGGIICLDDDGIGLAFNTPRMAYGFKTSRKTKKIGINQDDFNI